MRPIFSRNKMRLLFLDNGSGSVACRIHGETHLSTLPRLSEYNRIEYATGSLMRMNNLAAVRGKRGASMIGPADYYGNLEKPNQCAYSIAIKDGLPMMYRHQLEEQTIAAVKKPVPESQLTTIHGTWISNKDPLIHDKLKEYAQSNQPVLGESIFPTSGILEIAGPETIDLKLIDARDHDLSPFKARLVANNEPFQITKEQLNVTDEYRAVSYQYEAGYTNNQIEHSGGLFLETHSFAQTMTPLDHHSGGYITLGRRIAGTDAIDLIAFKIPYGYTLIVEEHCMHGDATFSGMYMMCMTSNHVTMQTADSVFLKNQLSKKNIRFNTEDQVSYNPESAPSNTLLAPAPLVVYHSDDDKEMARFLETTKELDFIFNPWSNGFIRRGLAFMRESSLDFQILGGFIAALGIAAVVLGFAALNAVTFGAASVALVGLGVATTLAGIGLYKIAAINPDTKNAGQFYDELPKPVG
ncbi:MAG: hypothetical protein PSV35_04980 [bacterium]|nr:hypothetical protein [bacterium]